jgi:ribosomal protein S18 acetylase RimI-like enzyme
MSKEISYRKAALSDAKKLSILYKQVYIQTYGVEGVSDEFANFITKQFAVERIEKTIQEQPDCLIVAVYKNNLVGVAEIEFAKKSPVGTITAPELNKLYILEWFCGQGIGNKLLTFAEQIARDAGETKMWLWVLESNERAIQFYEKNQYQKIGMAPFQMETNRYENYVMLKTLTERE